MEEMIRSKQPIDPDVPSKQEWAKARQKYMLLKLKKMMLDLKRPTVAKADPKDREKPKTTTIITFKEPLSATDQ